LSPYNVIIYLFCIELLLYSKDVTFDPVPCFIICVRLGPSTPGDYVRARVLVPLKSGCDTQVEAAGLNEDEMALIIKRFKTALKGRKECPNKNKTRGKHLLETCSQML
jgi:hypothetical protein